MLSSPATNPGRYRESRSQPWSPCRVIDGQNNTCVPHKGPETHACSACTGAATTAAASRRQHRSLTNALAKSAASAIALRRLLLPYMLLPYIGSRLVEFR